MLSEKDKEKIEFYVLDQDIDESELPSAHYDPNPYGVEDHLIGSSGGWFADEDEVYEAKKEQAISKIKEDGAYQWMDVDEDIDDNEVIEYIRGL